MFFHVFKYTLRALLKNRGLIFWTLVFPIAMAIFFNMAFSDIEKKEKFDAIDVAVVQNEYFENNSSFKEIFDSLSDDSNENKIFNTKYVSKEEAKLLLEKDEISGYVIFSEESQKISINKNGVNQTIFKFVVEEIVQSKDTADIIQSKVKNIMDNRGTVGFWGTVKAIMELMQSNNANLLDITESNLSYTMIEFYTLIAMTCLYGGILGAVCINWCLANMCNIGKRLSVTPVSKFKLVISSTLAGYVVQLIGVALLFAFTAGVLKIDYGSRIFEIILLAVAGSFAGLTMGVAVTVAIKASENAKTGILIGFTMLGCFFSGMMGITMKYVIDKNIPIINKLNPANMITDGFYALYYYDTLDRYYSNILSLCIFSGIMLTIAIVTLRKQKYESI